MRPAARVAAISAVVLLPVFWLPRVISSDLMSHSYNAWLAVHYVRQGVEGLTLVRQWTNVLFDALLDFLIRYVSIAAAERIAVSLAVLAFFWGAWRFVRTVRGTVDTGSVAILVVLAHGWVLQQGLFNYYLALAGGFWFLSFAWGRDVAGVLRGAPFLLLSLAGNPLPAIWACGLVILIAIAERSAAAAWMTLLVGATIARAVLALPTWKAGFRWSADQALYLTGADQLITYSIWSLVPAVVLLAMLGFRALRDADDAGRTRWLQKPAVIALAATMLTVVVLPAAFRFGDAAAEVTLVPQRLSLAVAVVALAALTGRALAFDRRVASGLAATVLLLLYWQQRAIDREGEAAGRVLATLPSSTRVIGAAAFPSARVNLRHVVDRYCLARCWSYANYEPASGQFRLRATGPNPLVMHDFRAIRDVYFGRYVVRPGDLPAVELSACDSDAGYCLRTLAAGDVTGFPQR